MESNEERIERIRRRLDAETKMAKVLGHDITEEDELRIAKKKLADKAKAIEQARFIKRLQVGKDAEVKVKSFLHNLGFSIRDVSMEAKDDIYPPFDLIALSPGGVTYIIDVKSQCPRARMYHISKQLEPRWKEYRHHGLKILIFYTDKTWQQEYTKHLHEVVRYMEVSKINGRGLISFDETLEVNELL